METSSISVGQLLYKAEINFTKVVEYGVSLEGILAGSLPVPAAGARFDVHFRGTVLGPKMGGEIEGIDYLEMRADGYTRLHLHAQITTGDQENVAFFADGTLSPQEGSAEWLLRENIALHSNSSTYEWVNHLQGWGQGTVDPAAGLVRVTAYSA